MRAPLPQYRREIVNTPDGDIIAADWIDGGEGQPLFILIHGMEGDSESRYARILMNQSTALGWTGVVLHMRSCGGLINRKPQFYHAGFYDDIQYFADEIIPERYKENSIYMAGVSLGGSQLGHYLAKGKPSAHVKAAALISAPVDLRASADYMQGGLNRLYIHKFVWPLLRKYRQKQEIIKNPGMLKSLSSARSFWELDNAATAPMHGFKDAADYYAKMSLKNVLKQIKLPTVYIAAKDDPFVPLASMPAAIADVPSMITDKGGHVGFVDRRGRSWMVPAVFKFFEAHP